MKSPFDRGQTVYVSNYQVVANSSSNHRRWAKICPNGFNLVMCSNWLNPKKSCPLTRCSLGLIFLSRLNHTKLKQESSCHMFSWGESGVKFFVNWLPARVQSKHRLLGLNITNGAPNGLWYKFGFVQLDDSRCFMTLCSYLVLGDGFNHCHLLSRL